MSNKKLISDKDVRHVAGLARIHLQDTEIDKLTTDLENILEYVTKLEKLDIDHVAPTSHVLALSNVYREDKVTSEMTQEEALSFAVEKKNGFFKVPKVIES